MVGIGLLVIACYVCVFQLGFESLVPTLTSNNIDGLAIGMCVDDEDFAELFSTVEPKETEKCYQELKVYFKKNKMKRR